MGTYGDEFNEAIAAELRAERGRSQLSVDALATATGLSKSSTLNYLNNKRHIPTPAFVELCKAMGVKPRVIFERAEQSIEQN